MENIKVFVRVRPEEEKSSVLPFTISAKSLLEKTGQIYEFDHVFSDWSQTELFKRCALPLVQGALDGYNSTLFAYGQTGSGKTYTIQGEAGEDEGIAPRALKYLYSKKDSKMSIRVSFIEIYNERAADLVGESNNLILRESGEGGVVVEGLDVRECEDVEEAMGLYSRGVLARKTASTASNERSSRSHCIFTVYLAIRSGMGITRVSRLNLVDLAGSEKLHVENHENSFSSWIDTQEEREETKRAKGGDGRAMETGNINRSLLCLGRVISGLLDNQAGRPRHVNYRDSKITFLLKDSLKGNAKIVVVGTLTSSEKSINESRNTLNFLGRARLVRTSPSINTEMNGRAVDIYEHVQALFVENAALRNQKAQLEEKVQGLERELAKGEARAEDEERAGRVSVEAARTDGIYERGAGLEREIARKMEEVDFLARQSRDLLQRVEKLQKNSGLFQKGLFDELRMYRLAEIERLWPGL
jgi:kinesin family member 15